MGKRADSTAKWHPGPMARPACHRESLQFLWCPAAGAGQT